jgi:D-glycero-D-manno-heptose 1,7-bisphosphate phosphatase
VKRPAVFVDRDGTINEQMGYINHISRFVLLPGAVEGIRLLNSHKYLVVVVSNQSGIARGYFPIELVDEVHAHMRALLEREGALVDGIFFCPHHKGGNVPQYSIACNCRKPRVGLIEKACESFDINMANSFVVGDRYTDIELAHRANLKGVLVTTGYGRGDVDYVLPHTAYKPAFIAKDLLYAVRWIIEQAGS